MLSPNLIIKVMEDKRDEGAEIENKENIEAAESN